MNLPERELARLYAESGADEWSVSREQFSEWLTETLAGPRLREFVLARACAAGNEKAWDFFVSHYRPKLYATGTAIARDEVQGRELADSLYGELFGTRITEDGKRLSKLRSFMGRGSLEGWLRTVLAQEYVNRFRRERKAVPFDEAIETPGLSAEAKTELFGDRQALAQATDTALGELESEERLVLAAYYLDERSLAEIGRMMGLHESTVSRRVEKITARLRRRIIGLLVQGGMAKRTAEELLEIDVRVLEINVREKLAQERQA